LECEIPLLSSYAHCTKVKVCTPVLRLDQNIEAYTAKYGQTLIKICIISVLIVVLTNLAIQIEAL